MHARQIAYPHWFMHFAVKLGSQLTLEELQTIGALWETSFPLDPTHKRVEVTELSMLTDKLVTPTNRVQYADDVFFLLVDTAEVAGPVLWAASRLRPATFALRDGYDSEVGTALASTREISVLGISDVAVSESCRGKGLGKKMMSEMQRFAVEKDAIMVGYCSTKNGPFYRTCGFHVLPDTCHLVEFWDEAGHKHSDAFDNDVFFQDNAAQYFANTVAVELQRGQSVRITRPHW